MRQSQGQKKPLQKSTLYEREKKKKNTLRISMPYSITLLCFLPSTAPCMFPILAGPYKILRAT